LIHYQVNNLHRNYFSTIVFYFLVDPGSSKFFNAHRILFKKNIYVLENVAALDLVLKYLSNRRETFFAFDVLPMKIEGGTGAPCRLVARFENSQNISGGWFGFLIFCLFAPAIGIVGKVIYEIKFNSRKNFG